MRSRRSLLGAALLALIYLWSSYGVGPMLRWGAQRGRGQLTGLGPLVARALPLLLLFTTFLFINAEVWQVAGTLDGLPYVLVIAIFFGLGATFVLTRVPGYIRQENRFATWAEIAGYLDDTPAAASVLPTERAGGRSAGRAAAIQHRPDRDLRSGAADHARGRRARSGSSSCSAFLAIPADTVAELDRPRTISTSGSSSRLSGRTLVLTEPLVRVSVFLGAFAGMYFTVVLSTDDTYRNEFADDVGPEIRQALAVREVYRVRTGDVPSRC